jgi:hypothetical protein
VKTDYKPDWSKYDRLADAIVANRECGPEFEDLLRDARADAVRFVQDIKAEESIKIFAHGIQTERNLVVGYLRKNGAAFSDSVSSQDGLTKFVSIIIGKVIGTAAQKLADIFEHGEHDVPSGDGETDKGARLVGVGGAAGLRSERDETDYWRRMALRAMCGCISLDCRHHGAYIAEECTRAIKARDEDRETNRKRYEASQL